MDIAVFVFAAALLATPTGRDQTALATWVGYIKPVATTTAPDGVSGSTGDLPAASASPPPPPGPVEEQGAGVGPSGAGTDTAGTSPASTPPPDNNSPPSPSPADGPSGKNQAPAQDSAVPTDGGSPVTPSSPPVPSAAGSFVPAHPRKGISADYPTIARERGYEGRVLLDVAIDASGKVESVHVVVSSGHPLLDEAATGALRSTAFDPARKNGQAEPSTKRIAIEFRLIERSGDGSS